MNTPAGTDSRETVLIVHGTFAGQDPSGDPGWYAPGQDFCRQLDEALASGDSRARCWQHLAAGSDHFHWDGANDWLSRFKAAARLRREIRQLRADGWTVHVVAHSHGGNIVVDAISDDAGRVEPWFDGRVVLLGTPLLRESEAFRARRRGLLGRWAAASLVGWALLLFMASRGLDLRAPFVRGAEHENWASVLFLVLMVALLVLLARGLVRFAGSGFTFLHWASARRRGVLEEPGRMRRSPAFMMINSRFDEAYRSLAAVQQGPNPLMETQPAASSLTSQLQAVADTGLRRLTEMIGRTLNTRHVAALGWAGFVSIALLLATRWLLPTGAGSAPDGNAALLFWMICAAIAVAACFFDRFVFLPGIVLLEGLGTVFRAIKGLAALRFARQIRGAVWGFTQSLVLGLSGAARRVQDVRVQMRFEPGSPEDCVQLELPEPIVKSVIEAQTARLAQARDILYREGGTWSPVALRTDLEAIDFPLVHTTYYRQPECVRKTADWLCEPRIEEFDGTTTRQVTAMNAGSRDGLVTGTIEQVTSLNAYRRHVEALQDRHGGAGSPWAPPGADTTPTAPAPAAPRPGQGLRRLSPLSGPPPRRPP